MRTAPILFWVIHDDLSPINASTIIEGLQHEESQLAPLPNDHYRYIVASFLAMLGRENR